MKFFFQCYYKLIFIALLATFQIQVTEANSNIPEKSVYPNQYVSMNSNYYQPRYPQVFYTSGMYQGLGKTFISSEPGRIQSQTKYVQNTPNRYYTSETRRQYGYNRQPQSQSNAVRKQFFLNPVRNTGVQNSVNNNRRTTTLRSAVKRNTPKRNPIRMVFAKW